MQNQLNFRFIFLALIRVFLITTCFQSLNAQTTKKNTVRFKADYVKIMDGESYLDITATSRIDKKNVEIPNIDVTVFNEFEDEKIKLGTTTTDMHGKGKFQPSYNIQSSVDTKSHLIAAYEVTSACTDQGLLTKMATKTRDELGVDTLEVVADKG